MNFAARAIEVWATMAVAKEVSKMRVSISELLSNVPSQI
jgi:hypothetical protein